MSPDNNELEPTNEKPTEVLTSWEAITEVTDIEVLESVPVDAPKKSPPAKIKAMAMNKTVWVMVVIALVCLAGGIGISQLVISPSQAAAQTEPPEAGLITIPVEKMALSNDVTVRGDARYDDAVDVALETGELGGRAVVTGAVPKVGAQLEPGNVALEIVGRPVIVLPGELPVYRTLVAGTSGPDVAQLRAALNGMGYAAGEGNVYDSTLAAAVRELFAQAGYAPPQAPQAVRDALKGAEQGLSQAQQGLTSAQNALAEADKGPSSAERIRLDNAVDQANRALEDAKSCKPNPAAEPPVVCPSVADAEGALRLAEAERADAVKAPSLDGQISARDEAARAVSDAQEALGTAQAETLTPLPASEVLYLPSLPRRVDAVNVTRGSVVPTSAVMSVSGATLEIEASVAQADADLLTVGQKASLVLGDDKTFPATIKEINKSAKKDAAPDADSKDKPAGNDGRMQVILVPDKLSEEERTSLVGSNVRVVIPVSSTKGDVLAVPIAALTAGAGGETRVQVLREGKEEPELVTVTTGLSAKGYAEIASSEAPLEPGDLVVVGP